MLYVLLRVLIILIIFVFLYFIYFKKKISGIQKKKNFAVYTAITCVIIISLSFLVPVENLFIRFSTPERAFLYTYFGHTEIIGTIEGNNSAMILYGNLNSSTMTIKTKDERGWKIGVLPCYDELFFKKVNHPDYLSSYYVNIYKVKDTNDYYILIWIPFAEKVAEITDNENSLYQYTIGEHKNVDKITIHYYAYIENIGEDYKINIDGEVINISQ